MSAVVAGDADYRIGAQQRACLIIGRILLADMHAIGTDFQGQVGAVIDEHCDIMFVRNGDQCFGSLDDLRITDILEA
ncbi:hypothetical protein NBRC116588_06600 [Pyruvatibacter sp. HU-CL02332]